MWNPEGSGMSVQAVLSASGSLGSEAGVGGRRQASSGSVGAAGRRKEEKDEIKTQAQWYDWGPSS